MKEKFITITGFRHYYGIRPFAIGNLIRAQITATVPMRAPVGYVANSPDTVAGGTMSAGRIYDHVKKRFFARVMFTTFTKVICKIEFGSPDELEREFKAQMRGDEDDGWETEED